MKTLLAPALALAGVPAAATAQTVPFVAVPPPRITAASATAPAIDVPGMIRTGWAKYDHGGKGSLTALEFGTWILAARGVDVSADLAKPGSGMMIKVLNATMPEFLKADTDHSGSVTRDELAAYLAA